ncbi:UMTA methyltransferase family protein [Kalaharituber pfeilii]|nr:UMTA methyltransferase family protein [Kalaharituber pfeilii]
MFPLQDYNSNASEEPLSGITTGDCTATTSLSSSVFSFQYANGRRYHSDRFKTAEYFMPNDEMEQERLDLYHHIFLTILGGMLYTAPLDRPQRVLDVGTGTGIWAIDFADEQPQAEVIATDISPIQPNWVPPNVKFEVVDMEDTWTYPKNFFDYIHIRTLSGAFKNWDAILRKSYEHLVPGGYLEFQDYGFELFSHDGKFLTDTSAVAYMYHLVVKYSIEAGRPAAIARGMEQCVKNAGFEDVTVRKELWPLGDWPKDKELRELGRYARVGMNNGLHAFSAQILSRYAKWSPNQINELVEMAKKDLAGGKYYSEAWFIYGRKPVAKN